MDSNICRNCIHYGDITACERAECDVHKSWYVKQLKEEIKRLNINIERINAFHNAQHRR